MLALVAPVTMTSEQQELWLRAAIDALDGIRADEVQAVSYEVRRTVTRPPQIVPTIAKLVSERREANARTPSYSKPLPPLPPPAFSAERLSRAELEAMTPAMRSLGLKYGHLEYRSGQLAEVRGEIPDHSEPRS